MAFIVPDFSSVACLGNFCLRYSYVAIAMIPIIIGLYFLIRHTFVGFMNRAEAQHYERAKKNQRMIFFVVRSLLIAMIMIALAGPFLLESRTVQGNPRITILVDNSTSMNLFESGLEEPIVDALGKRIPITVQHIAVGDGSAIGDGVLQNLQRDENVLVITDGNNNRGKLLGDIMLLASSLNATVSTLAMDSLQSDVGISILGPSEAIRDTTEQFLVEVNNVGNDIPYTLEVRVDNQIVLAQSGSGSGTFTVNRRLTEGYHTITAELLNVGSADYFIQNNKFYKTVNVVPRPSVLFVTEKASPLEFELGQIYDITATSTIPTDLSPYLAVVLNDIPARSMLQHTVRLSDYVSDGNGLFVIGGENSYDRGGYKGTLIDTLLPVKIGAGEDSEKSDVHIVLVIDISHGTEDYVNIEKAQAVSVIHSLDEKNNVGVIAFSGSAFNVADVAPLSDNKEELIDKVSRLTFDGQSFFNLGIEAGMRKLRGVSGGKNIILISDGKTTYNKLMDDTLAASERAAASGIKVYTVGVGERRNDPFLEEIARVGQGIYFPVDASNKLKVLFGEPEDSEGQEYLNTLVLLDTTHFITFNRSVDAVISGYNYVIPKAASRLLVSTNKNIPILVAWRFGLGRVVSLGTDDGGKWGGELLQEENSPILTKSINWAIGDLTRKRNFDVRIKDSTVDDPLRVEVISSTLPSHNELEFVKRDVGLFTATYEADEPGLLNFLGADVAVNYEKEFQDLGTSQEFLQLVTQTGGEIFAPDDIDAILEFIQQKSKRIKVDSTEVAGPFIIIAIILLLIDIGLRRMWENKAAR